jgi:hypothetical protein
MLSGQSWIKMACIEGRGKSLGQPTEPKRVQLLKCWM